MLGGERFDGPGLEGHSDADVLTHAVVDALLGAAALGDIGRHFPDTEAQWKNAPSLSFLTYAKEKLIETGWIVWNVDVTVIAETPRISQRSEAIRANLARALGIDTGRVNIKATTNETMGAIGRREGIAAFAVATIAECYGGERDNGCPS